MSSSVKEYTEEEISELVTKITNFKDYVLEKFGESDEYELNLDKISAITDFIYDNEVFSLNLDIFDLSSQERSIVESNLRVTFVRSAKEILYVPTIPDGFSRVEDLKANGVIFEEYWDLVPNTCNACGSDIVSNHNLTIVKCSNMRCKHNLASSLRKIAVKESISGLGEKSCFNYFNSGKLKSVFDVFESPDALIYGEIDRIKSRKRQYAEWVKFLSLPGIETQANYLFKGINSYDDYLRELNKCGSVFNFCLNRLGGEGKQASNVAQVLEAYDYELKRIDDFFPIGVEAECIIEIAMTGNIYFSIPGAGRFTKQKFLDYINSIYPEYINFRKTESVNRAFAVISDYASGSSKYNAGKALNKLISSEDLVGAMCCGEPFLQHIFPDTYKEKVEYLKSVGRLPGYKEETQEGV